MQHDIFRQFCIQGHVICQGDKRSVIKEDTTKRSYSLEFAAPFVHEARNELTCLVSEGHCERRFHSSIPPGFRKEMAMPEQPKPPVTQRAYTLRLRGVNPQDTSWRDSLWHTHEAVNKGAKAFGDWLLTLRGGLDHSLADEPVFDPESEGGKKLITATLKELKKSKSKEGGDPSNKEAIAEIERRRNNRIRDRRILLALSWLSVESEKGAPDTYFVPHDLDKQRGTRSNWKTIDALKEILKKHGLGESDIESWVQDCSASLSAAVRRDAVWVNRSKAFDEACNGQNKQQAREDAQTLLRFLLTDDYLALPKSPKERQPTTEDGGEDESGADEAEDAVAKSGKGAGQRTRHPFSHIFGRENTQGFGKPVRILKLRNHWQSHLKPLVEAAGIPLSDPNSKAKGETPSPTELHREMFSKAAARLAQIWTKQKQQELARELRAVADADLKKLESDPAFCKPLELLNAYCRERGQAAGSLEEYRINPRAVEGWERVVAAWEKIKQTDPAKAAEKRIDEAKRLQEEDPDKKFGDINLFINLAEPEYEPVWRHNGHSTPSILRTYVKGWKARSDAVRLKVAAFRHPDPYFHPVFCQFGVSRPPIEYSRLNINPAGGARGVQMRLWTGSQAENVRLLAVSNRFDKEIGSIGESIGSTSSDVPAVTRRSRLGIAGTARPDGSDTFRVAHVFDHQEVRSRKREDQVSGQDQIGDDNSQGGKQKKPSWNGTLQADRRELEAIGRLEGTNSEKVEQAKQHLRWWLIVSLELQPKGPWYDFIENSSDKAAFNRVYKSGKNKGKQYVSLVGWPHENTNRDRKGHARLILSHLPGLRVLSVDLGHRYAAACAVWEALSAEELKEACRAVGQKEPNESDLYLHLKRKVKKQKKGKEVEVEETTVYRRIGADTLREGKSHPAPWARLDRQFLIKLQGEEEGAREASNDEIWAVHQLEAELGRAVPIVDRLVKAGLGKTEKQKARLDALRNLGWTPAKEAQGSDETDEGELRKPSRSVDELMFSAVRTMRLALKRHGDRARIAFAMTADYKAMPGDRKYYFTEAKELSANDDEDTRRLKHIEFIQDALVFWHGLASSRGWRDDAAKQLWDEHIAGLPGYKALEEIGEEASAAERNKKQREDRGKLQGPAIALAGDDKLRALLHEGWKKRWTSDDDRLKKQLRWLRDWVLPRGKISNDPAIRKVGGLSLTRLATLTEFRCKVQPAFFTRFTPEGRQMRKDEKGRLTDEPLTTGERFGQSTLDALEHLREQRVKQLASRIAEAALGIGREHIIPTTKEPQKKCWCGQVHGKKDPKRPRDRVDQPCHAVVIENLTNYRPEETRTRRENRQLMTWSSSKVKKYLAEACQLHGLHLREVSASYTSRQDSRTGAPGVRCQDVPVREFMQSRLWRKQVKKAEKKQVENKGDSRERFLCDLNAKWKDKAVADWDKAGAVRIPIKWGEIFVSANPCDCCKRQERKGPAGLQADLNAAANIGLRALTDPDWPGKWWYVPCDPTSFKPSPDRVRGSTAINLDKPLKDTSVGSPVRTRKKSGKASSKSKEVVNLWRDVSSRQVSASNGPWEVYAAYQNQVQARVVKILRGVPVPEK